MPDTKVALAVSDELVMSVRGGEGAGCAPCAARPAPGWCGWASLRPQLAAPEPLDQTHLPAEWPSPAAVCMCEVGQDGGEAWALPGAPGVALRRGWGDQWPGDGQSWPWTLGRTVLGHEGSLGTVGGPSSTRAPLLAQRPSTPAPGVTTPARHPLAWESSSSPPSIHARAGQAFRGEVKPWVGKDKDSCGQRGAS